MRMSLFSKLEGQIFLICCVCSDKYIRIAPLFVVEYADFLRPLPHLVPQNSGKFWLTYYGSIVSEWNIKVAYDLRGEPSQALIASRTGSYVIGRATSDQEQSAICC
jgi:hypothetical protein